MAMKNPYNYSVPKSAFKLKKDFIKNNTETKSVEDTSTASNTAKNKLDNYMEQKILTARPEELTLMLYEGLVKFIKQARIFIEEKNIEKSHKAIIKSQDIISELNITLNMDYEVSSNLRSIYTYMNDRLVDANINKDIKSLDVVLGLAEELRDTWKQAMGTVNINTTNG